MANPVQRKLCPSDRLEVLMRAVQKNEPQGLADLLSEYPDDARLHFLKGSLLAGRQDYVAARAAMQHALDLAPDFAIARFQLGLLLLTSGEIHKSLEIWGPLHILAPDNFLRLFVIGLCHLVRDEFDEAIRYLEKGISQNQENLPMNHDMQLVIEEARKKMADQGSGDSAVSSVDQLLKQAALKARLH